MTAVLLAAGATISLKADPLKNGDLKDGLTYWHGDGQLAYLKDDGTEGSEGDLNVTPVIKIPLSHGHRGVVYQEFDSRENQPQVNIQLDLMGSPDFKNLSKPMGPNEEGSALEQYPRVPWDFQFLFLPNFPADSCKMSIGKWKTWKGEAQWAAHGDRYKLMFIVPPGEGAVYIRNLSLSWSATTPPEIQQ